ncbi:MAG: GH3 auxin-responsive promoter family protein [Anaerolineales bacterium]|nr:GH3 auxin-responsive promoter family protein [Anaerolineales bacterium]
MNSTLKLLQEGRNKEIWTRHCGFLDLSRKEFMDIQKRLLMEQIELLSKSKIGQALFKGKTPASVEEFRKNVPMTRYDFYYPFLKDKNEDGCPGKPYIWVRTSGRSSESGEFKLAPYTKEMFEKLGDYMITGMLLASSSHKGEVNLTVNERVLLATAPPPYLSGLLSHSIRNHLNVRFLPPLEEGEQMEFGERIAKGFRMAIEQGMDYFYGISSILVRIGEQFEGSSATAKPSVKMLNLAVLWRLLRAVATAKLHNRDILPRDIWKLKGIMTGGTDTSVYRQKIEHYWGKQPLEVYASTEGSTMATQAWNYKGMIFVPDNAFLEFIPYEEHLKSIKEPDYTPKTVLYDELELGIYEIVFTNFHGGVFVRYRIGDLFKVTALSDDELGNELPQFQFYSSVRNIIDLGGLVRLTERDIWQAIENAGVRYQEWAVRKEYDSSEPILHLYIELKPSVEIKKEEIQKSISEELSKLLDEYQDFKEITGRDPLKLSIIPNGAFQAYMKSQQDLGADLAHIKPPHIQPNDKTLEKLNRFQK